MTTATEHKFTYLRRNNASYPDTPPTRLTEREVRKQKEIVEELVKQLRGL